MSLFEPAEMACLACGAPQAFELAASVNADRRPDLRSAMLDGSFQRITCASCGATTKLPPTMTYLDLERGQWIMAKPAWDIPEWFLLEQTARDAYALSFGPDASAQAQKIGRRMRPRIVFGWAALREKLLAADYGIDDVVLELLKLAVLRNVSGAPLTDTNEFRLIQTDGETLRFAWLEPANEREGSYLDLDRANLADIDADAAWAPLRTRLTEAFYVDMNRLMMASPPALEPVG